MSEDRLLRELARLAEEERVAEQRQLDERWDRLTAGTLSAAEEAELQALAARSEEAGLAYEAFRPLGPDFEARMVSALRTQVAQPGSVTAPVKAQVAVPVEIETAAARPASRALPWRGRRARLGSWWAAAATVAATVLVLVRGVSQAPPLPLFVATLDPAAPSFRGTSTTDLPRQPFHPDDQLELAVRPETAVSVPLDVRFFRSRGGDPEPWEPPYEMSSAGTVHVHGAIGAELRLDPGDWTLWIVVGRQDQLPAPDRLRWELAAPAADHADWQVLRVDLRVADE